MRNSRITCRMWMIASLILSFIALLFLAGGAHAQFFNNPESAAYDTLNDRYLISNVGSGDIVQISEEGDTSYFHTSLTRTLGMVIVDNMLYVADYSGIVEFDLSTDQMTATIPIAGMNVLNDVTADTSGHLYVTDSANGNIYRVRISDHADSTIVSGIYWPNGILFDERNNRVLFCAFGNNVPIREIDLEDFSVSTVITTGFTDLDGLTIDNEGNIYVSSWGSNSIYQYDNAFSSPPELISSGHSGPADIFYNRSNDVLVVPNFNSNSVDFLEITPAGVEETPVRVPRSFSLAQNYPNPFNPSTTISYEVDRDSRVRLEIFDLRGRRVRTLVDGDVSVGLYSVAWDGGAVNGERVASGVYICRLSVISDGGIFEASRKMMVVK